MGEVYRIIFVHVPSAFSAFFMAFSLFVVSVLTFVRPDLDLGHKARAISEVGFILTLLTLITGSLWGYPTWGTFWTWDARLTTTLILALMYAGYMLLYHALPDDSKKSPICAALGIIIFIDVIIIYKSVTWWRTLHQPPTLLRSEGATMEPRMLAVLLLCLAAELAVTLWLTRQREIILKVKAEIERLRMQSLRAME
jgi:heme exporter protein C